MGPLFGAIGSANSATSQKTPYFPYGGAAGAAVTGFTPAGGPPGGDARSAHRTDELQQPGRSGGTKLDLPIRPYPVKSPLFPYAGAAGGPLAALLPRIWPPGGDTRLPHRPDELQPAVDSGGTGKHLTLNKIKSTFQFR